LLRKRFFAWFLRKGDRLNDQIYGRIKAELFQEINGKVVEIGPGTGVNFEYLPKDIEWLGIEPNELFWPDLKRKAESKGIVPRIEKGSDSRLPLADDSADVALVTLVLCSVKNPGAMIAEIKRILKPGGRLIFIEHVAAEPKTFLSFLQSIFNPVGKLLADGCNCNRETWKTLEAAGFSRLEISRRQIDGTFVVVKTHIIGYAVK
jgi:ubiquinone/menaquinone biosynthesis C-methylase UbiE